MKGTTLYTCLMATLLALTGCGSTGMGNSNEAAITRALDELGVDRGQEVNSVSNFRLTGWHDVNDRNLIVTAGMHNHYLLTLVAPCFELNYAFGISFQRRSVALSAGDYVVVNSLHRQGGERCQIMDIIQLVDREENAE